MKIKLKNLNFDERLLELRPLDWFVISTYRQAYRAGKDLGKIIIDSVTKNIVSGNHRVNAMLEEFGEDHVIEAEAVKFGSYREILEKFTEENVSHGRPLNKSSKKAIASALMEEGASTQEIANLFGVAIQRIEKWGSDLVARVGNGREQPKIRPVKRGIKNNVKMTNKQYKEHMKHDVGISVAKQASQITKYIYQNWIDTDDPKNIEALWNLRQALNQFFEKRSKSSG